VFVHNLFASFRAAIPGSMLVFFLVFHTNQAYNRFWVLYNKTASADVSNPSISCTQNFFSATGFTAHGLASELCLSAHGHSSLLSFTSYVHSYSSKLLGLTAYGLFSPLGKVNVGYSLCCTSLRMGSLLLAALDCFWVLFFCPDCLHC
jgi:hypothetical protein